jgi:membrane-bound lytic murein transglycosylase D
MQNLVLRSLSILIPFLLSACAVQNAQVVSTSPEADTSKSTAEPVAPVKEKPANKVATVDEIENFTIEEVIRIEEPNTQTLYDNSRYDFPITMNSRVEGWIDYFTGRGREHMERYLGRSSRYIPMMKQVLKRSGLPEDLVYLALIESGFNLRAKSRARAVGPWQFMKATGKRYGLRVDAWIDERRDPIRSTEAAARYLKDLYLMFESWYLAAAAYNAGEYKILRAIDQGKTNNFWRIADTRLIRRETKDYVPKLIAAAIIAKNPSKYGFEDISYLEPLEFESAALESPVPLKEIAELTDTDLEDIEELNPHLRRGIAPPDADNYEIRIPTGKRALVERAASNLKNKYAGVQPMVHSLRRGETLSSVARKYRVSTKELASLNNLDKRERIAIGTELLIPGRTLAARESSPKAQRATSGESPTDGEFVFHTVRRGESLWSISEQYDVTVQDIFKWNGMKRSRIFPGKKLRIRAPENTSAHSSRESKRHLARKSRHTR